MNQRHPFALLAIVAMANFTRGQGPYSILLETGDTIVAKEYYTKTDTLGLTGTARVAKRDVILFWTNRERWTFTYPGGRMSKIKEKGSDPCVLGHICAERFADHISAFDSLPIPEAWKTDTTLLACYRRGLLDRDISTEENGDRMIEGAAPEGLGGVAPGEPNQLILRTGDTLFVKKDFYAKDSVLCWYGGPCRPTSEVLLIRTIKGQFYFPAAKRLKSRLRAPLPDLSVGPLGRLHANIQFASCNTWEETDIPAELKLDPAFLESYKEEVERLVEEATARKNRGDALRILAGGVSGGLAYGAMGAAMNAGGRAALTKPEKRPYWGTPMPE